MVSDALLKVRYTRNLTQLRPGSRCMKQGSYNCSVSFFLCSGPDSGAYYHELFLRGRPALCYRMKRQKVKGTGHKQPADPNTEPNFYIMRPVQSQAPPSLPPPPPPALSENNLKEPPSPPHGQQYEGQQVHQRHLQERPPKNIQQSPPLSPGIQSVHGAAHMLRGIATGQPYRGVILPSMPFDGLPSSAAPDSKGNADSKGSISMSDQNKRTSRRKHWGASFLPRQEDDHSSE